MTIPELLFVALVISLDNFAAFMALGALGQRERRLRIAFAFGFFGGLAPLIGILIGHEVAGRLAG